MTRPSAIAARVMSIWARPCYVTKARSVSCSRRCLSGTPVMRETSSRAGPWSFDNKAVGSHKGSTIIDDERRNLFSVAVLFDEALGVKVVTAI
jgi:hypothetical protein